MPDCSALIMVTQMPHICTEQQRGLLIVTAVTRQSLTPPAVSVPPIPQNPPLWESGTIIT